MVPDESSTATGARRGPAGAGPGHGRVVACLLAVAAGLALRVLIAGEHEHPRGDVLLDVGTARSLAAGEGFGAGFTRGAFFDLFDTDSRVRDAADQHPPLWPLAGALLGPLAGSAFGGLKLASWLLGVLLILLVAREADRLTEGWPAIPDGLPALAAALAALSFVLVDASANGSLYVAQACLVLLLPAVLGAPRPSVAAGGLLLGATLLLNHQATVLLPVPVLVLALAPADGRRLAGAGRGLAMVALALLVQVPWWWRNAQVFGHPLYSTNLAYVLQHAGVPASLLVEEGVPVLRFEGGMTPARWLAVARTWLLPNVLYVFSTGTFVWAGLLGVVAAAWTPLALGALAARHRRMLAHLLVLALLAGVSVLWPATKLRYLVPLTPLVVVVGIAALARRPGRLERAGAILVVLAWAAMLVLTRDDWLDPDRADARPTRWLGLLAGGGVLVVAPLLMHAFALGSGRLRLGVVSGLIVAPLLSAAVFWPRTGIPSTAYHSSVLTPDVFGVQAEFQKEVEAELLGQARAAALARGARRLVGPPPLIGHREPALVTAPPPLGGQGDAALAALLELEEPDHVITFLREPWQGHHLLLTPGRRWLGGRLEVVSIHDRPTGIGPDPPGLTTVALSAVVPPEERR